LHVLKCPPFEPGFIGLTAFSAVEPIEDYDYHYYDDSWNALTTRQIRAMKEAMQEEDQAFRRKIAQKSKGSHKLEDFAKVSSGHVK